MKKKIILTLLAATLAFGVVGCTSGSAEQGEQTQEETQIYDEENLDNFQSKDRDFYVDGEIELTKDASGVYLSGDIINDSGKAATYIAISFDLFDDNNQKLGTAKANVNNIEDGATWEFFAKGEPYIMEPVVEETTEEEEVVEETTEEAVEGETTEETVEGETTEETVEGETTEETAEGEIADEAVEGETTEEAVEEETTEEETVTVDLQKVTNYKITQIEAY